jgi:multidrug efflux pump
MLFFAIMLWIYKYYLVRAQDFFQRIILVWMETKYRNFLQFALTGKKTVGIFFRNIWTIDFIICGGGNSQT